MVCAAHDLSHSALHTRLVGYIARDSAAARQVKHLIPALGEQLRRRFSYAGTTVLDTEVYRVIKELMM